MKLIYQVMFVIGMVLFVAGTILWAQAGFPINVGELSTTLFGTKPWHLGKESYFVFVVLGAFIAAYAAFELKLKRWEKKQQ